MTVTPELLPIESTHCRVRARISNIYADSNDEGTGPDWRAPKGEAVTLVPSVAGDLLAYDAQGPEPRVVMVEKVECVVGEGGWLKTKADGADVYIVPTDDPKLSRTGWTWTATIRGKSIKFSAPMGGVVDLAMFVAAPATGSTKTWVDRIPELKKSLVSIATITSDAGDMVVTLTDGESHRLPMPSGPSAYEEAVSAGFTGSVTEWLESLKGEPGSDGVSPELPPISWEGDQLRVGDALSVPLTGPGGGLTETAAGAVTRDRGVYGGSITLTRLGTLRILDVRDVSVGFIGGKLTLNAADAAVTSSGGIVRSANDIYPVHISGTVVTIDAQVDAQDPALGVGGIVLWRAAS